MILKLTKWEDNLITTYFYKSFMFYLFEASSRTRKVHTWIHIWLLSHFQSQYVSYVGLLPKKLLADLSEALSFQQTHTIQKIYFFSSFIIQQIFKGNTDANYKLKTNLGEPVLAMFVRFVVREYNNWPCMRVEVYGEPTCKSEGEEKP